MSEQRLQQASWTRRCEEKERRMQAVMRWMKAGIAQARAKGTTFGRPKSAAKKTAEIRRLYRKEKLSKSEIARRLGIGRTSVRRILENS
jgi:DNA invertase Pin-like site-specific DNA recombinase